METIDIDTIAVRIRSLVAESVRRRPDEISLDARLDATQLGIDSLGLIKLSVRLEEAFDIRMPDLANPSSVDELGTVRDIAALVVGQIEKRSEARP